MMRGTETALPARPLLSRTPRLQQGDTAGNDQ